MKSFFWGSWVLLIFNWSTSHLCWVLCSGLRSGDKNTVLNLSFTRKFIDQDKFLLNNKGARQWHFNWPHGKVRTLPPQLTGFNIGLLSKMSKDFTDFSWQLLVIFPRQSAHHDVTSQFLLCRSFSVSFGITRLKGGFRPKTFGKSILSYGLEAVARTCTNNLRVFSCP